MNTEEQLVKLNNEVFEIKQEIQQDSIPDFFVNGRLDKDLILDWILELTEKNNRIVVTEDDEIIWRYNGGFYESNGERYIKALLIESLGTKIGEQTRREIIHNIRYDINKWIKYKDFDKDTELINLQNCIYNWKTGEVHKHNPEYLFAHQIPITYDKDAKCDNFLKFLNEVIDENDVPIIQELAGYLFYKSYPYHKAFMLVGGGGNGKSTLIDILTNLIGKENTTTVSLQNIVNDRFAIYHLHQKLANMCADLTDKSLRETGIFKMLTGQDRINAPRKHIDSLEFNNYAKLVFSCNTIPYAKDDSDAYFDRWIIINFPNRFRGTDKCNYGLKEELTTQEELSGIFNWAMEGLKRLLENNGFSYSKTTEDTRKEYIRSASSSKAFINECLMEVLEEEISKEMVFVQYKKFCENNDFPVSTKHEVTTKIKESFTNVVDFRKHGGESMWKNLKIRPPPKSKKLSF